MVLKDYDLKQFKDILDMVEYDIKLLKQEGGDFLGLAVVLNEDKLIFIFRSDNDLFDCDIAPWYLYLDRQYQYKQGYFEDYAVYELIDIFKSNNIDDLKIVIDNELENLKVIENNKVIFDCTIW